MNFLKYGISSVSLFLLFHTIPFLNEKTFDIIYCHFGLNGALAVKLREAGIISGKIVTVFHGFDLTIYLAKFDQMPYNELFEKGDLFLPISKRWERKIIDLGCNSQKISVHRMGIDTDKIALSTGRNTPNGGVKLLSVARLVEKKGIVFGIQAISKVIKKFPNIEYVIIGDGPLKNELQNKIDHLQMNRNIKLMGWMNQGETFAFMRQADIFLAPSVTSADGDQEGIPVVLMEAMAHGLPVISTHHSGIPELVVDHKTGLLVDERDSGALARKIEFLIANPDQLVKMGIEGRKAVEADYNIRALNGDLVKAFHQLVLPRK
jgi:colanic acid/amylovoran biosynthesis glycosyltransferase